MRAKIIEAYNAKKNEIKNHLAKFKLDDEDSKFSEFLFCTLTPQSNAKRCWEAVQIINKTKPKTEKEISEILKGRTRFHNAKAKRIFQSRLRWNKIKDALKNEKDVVQLRNHIEKEVDGFGLKEASHFLRNIGLSKNKIAILDRHILRNLKNANAINEEKIKNKKHYLELEKKAIEFAEKIEIPIDELDILFWDMEHGEFFK